MFSFSRGLAAIALPLVWTSGSIDPTLAFALPSPLAEAVQAHGLAFNRGEAGQGLPKEVLSVEAFERSMAKDEPRPPLVRTAMVMAQVESLLGAKKYFDADKLLSENFGQLNDSFPRRTAELVYLTKVGLGDAIQAVQTLRVNAKQLAALDVSRELMSAHLELLMLLDKVKPHEASPDVAQAIVAVTEGFARRHPFDAVAVAAFERLLSSEKSQAALMRKLWPTEKSRREHALQILRRLGNKGSHRTFALSLGGLSASLTRATEAAIDGLSLQTKAQRLADAEWFMAVREYGPALSILQELSKAKIFGHEFTEDKLLFLLARCANASSDPVLAARTYAELIEKHPKSTYADQAKRNYVLTLHLAKRHDEVPGELGRLAKGAPNLEKQLRWLAMWSRYLATFRRPASPLDATILEQDLLKVPLASTSSPREVDQAGLRIEYWAARLHERQGRLSEAIRGFEALTQSPNQSFYRIAARWRLSLLQEGSTSPQRANARVASSLIEGRSVALSGGAALVGGSWLSLRARANFPSSNLRRSPFATTPKALGTALQEPWNCRRLNPDAESLVKLGHRDAAREILARTRWAGLPRSEHQGCAQVAYDLEDFALASRLAYRGVERQWTNRSRPYAQKLQELRATASLVFPKAYRAVVETVADSLGLEPALIFAVMKAESNFRPKVSSGVGARGLMQIMPQTGARIAENLGYKEFHPDDLFQPPLNIAMGGWYLKFLLDYYQGDLVRAVAAYNAGPEAVDRWSRQSQDLEIDEFAENIPFSETHAYVRKVFGYMDSYLSLGDEGTGPRDDPKAAGLHFDFGPGLSPTLSGVEIF